MNTRHLYPASVAARLAVALEESMEDFVRGAGDDVHCVWKRSGATAVGIRSHAPPFGPSRN